MTQSGLEYNGHDAKEYVEYVRKYPDVFDKLMGLWGAFDLEGYRAFLDGLDLTVPYAAGEPTFPNYVANKAEIETIVQTRGAYPEDGVGGPYLTNEFVNNLYSRSASMYDAVWNSEWTQEVRKGAVATMGLTSGQRVLDIAIGTGNNFEFMPSDCRITGIDFNTEMLGLSEQKVREKNLTNVSLRKMDAHDLQFPDNSFDAVLSFYAMVCFEDPDKVVAEIGRVTAPGGTVVFNEPFVSDLPEIALFQYLFRPIGRELGAIYFPFSPPRIITYDSMLDISEAIEKAGLERVSFQWLDPLQHISLGAYRKG